MANSKPCSRCKTIQPVDQFRKNKSTPDGLTYYCKTCLNLQYKIYRQNKPRVSTPKDIERNRLYRQNNLDYIKSYRAKHYQENKELYRLSHKRYLDKNPGRNAELVRKYNARKLGNGVFKITTKELRKLRSEPCFYCANPISGTVDHVVPIIRGGTHSIGNLVAACQSCNSRKQRLFIMEWRIRKGKK